MDLEKPQEAMSTIGKCCVYTGVYTEYTDTCGSVGAPHLQKVPPAQEKIKIQNAVSTEGTSLSHHCKVEKL